MPTKDRLSQGFRVVSGLVPGDAKIIHPVFITPIAVQIVRDGRVTRPGFRLSGSDRGLGRIQPLVRHRHAAAKFVLIHETAFLERREYG
jgi:hypothetical protein